jgi:hypothetical protein
MLSEIFILRLEAILRAPIAPGTGNCETHLRHAFHLHQTADEPRQRGAAERQIVARSSALARQEQLGNDEWCLP